MPSKPQSPEEALSRALSRTLRHVARQQGIPQDDAGWCKIADILAKPPYTNMDVANEENILRAVDDNKKKRYELNADKTAIRAVQGHSVAVDVDMAPVTRDTLPPVLVHGTNAAAWPLIREHGLNRMKRLHVHLAPGLPGRDGVISGMRANADVHIYLNGPHLLEDGVPLFRAANGALLSPGIDGVIPPRYFARVTDASGRELD